MTDLTEFSDVVPDEMHLVKTPANAFDAPLLAKMAEEGVEKARMKAKERHSLDDSDFAFPKERKEPLTDESHVRNAISRFSSVEGVSDSERHAAARRIMSRAKDLGIEVSDDSDVAQAAKESADPGPSLVQTDAVEEPPKPGPDPDAQPEGDPPSISFPHNGESDGGGDTAPDKDLHRSEAESQTADNVEGIEKATPGSPAWEHEDVALGEKAEALATQLLGCIRTFTEREKAEGASKSLRRTARTARHVLASPNRLRKVAATMSDHSELAKVLGEYDKARRVEEKAQKKAERRKAEQKAAKAAKKAAKATGDEALAKAVERAEAAEAAAKEARETAEKIAAQDGKRIPLNEAGFAAVLRDADSRKTTLKSFDDNVAAAEAALEKAKASDDPYARDLAKRELRQATYQRTAMKMIAAEHARERDPQAVARSMRGQGVPLFTNRHALGDDPMVSGF